MIHALKRVLRIPGVIVGIWLLQLLVAVAASAPLRAAVERAMGKFSVLNDGQLLAHLGLLFIQHPDLAPQMIMPATVSAVLAAAAWTCLAGGIIVRLSDPPRHTGFFEAAGTWLPAMVTVSLWHLLLRALVLLAFAMVTAPLPRAASFPIMVLVMAFLTLTLDIARVHVVLHGSRPFHPKTAVLAFVQAVQWPRVLVKSIVLSLAQWATVAILVYLAVLGMDDGTGVIAARILGLPAIVLGLWRIAVVVEAGRLRLR